jgi:DNA polymerase-4
VRALWGIGPRGEEILKAAGYKTIGQLAEADASQLESMLGSRGTMLLEMARGIDDRSVETERERKSVGSETTFPRDLEDGAELRAELRRVALDAARRLAASEAEARTVVLKLRYADFRTISRQNSAAVATADAEEITGRAEELLNAVVEEGAKFRLVGVHCTNLVEPEGGQLSLFGDAS